MVQGEIRASGIPVVLAKNGARIIAVIDKQHEGGPVFVAVTGNVGDWAAYSGGGKGWEQAGEGSALWGEISRHGYKLTKAEASMVFPLLNPAMYRR